MLSDKWSKIRNALISVTEAIEPLRREKIIRSSLEAELTYPLADVPLGADEFAEIAIVADLKDGAEISVTKTEHHKCGRCWRLLPEVSEDGALCGRCYGVINA